VHRSSRNRTISVGPLGYDRRIGAMRHGTPYGGRDDKSVAGIRNVDYVGELTMREYRTGDAQALTDLYNTVERAAGGHPGYIAVETAELVEALVTDPARDTRLYFAPDGTVAAAGVVPTPPEGGFRVDLFGGVHPDWRGRGLGRDVLSWQLARTAEIHDAVAPDAEWQAEVGALVDDHTAQRLFERLGLAPVRYFFEMVASTKDVPAVALPARLRAEPYRPEVERALHAAHMEAFQDHWGYQSRGYEDWCAITVRSEGFRPELSRVAFDGDEIAGYVLTYADAQPDRCYIGQVGTKRPWRRRGLAGALLSEIMTTASGAGVEFMGLGVDADSLTGAVGVYERVGFEVESRFIAFRKPVPSKGDS
jgi:mycothiol synthase